MRLLLGSILALSVAVVAAQTSPSAENEWRKIAELEKETAELWRETAGNWQTAAELWEEAAGNWQSIAQTLTETCLECCECDDGPNGRAP